MKSWPDRLKEIPLNCLETQIKSQRSNVAIAQRDLETMTRIFSERTHQVNSADATMNGLGIAPAYTAKNV